MSRAQALDTILHGDALATLRSLPAESVHCIITSPPYWGLRDYGQPGQLGLEPTPDEYVAHMVEVFREARRVLRSDGSLWLNLGDSYAGGGAIDPYRRTTSGKIMPPQGRAPRTGNLKPKDLVGIPWRVAFALQADGWWLRSDIIWQKPNCMPESVRDRPTKSHEYVFLLTKSERYFYDADAVREPITGVDHRTMRIAYNGKGNPATRQFSGGATRLGFNPAGRNRRDVWSVATQPFKKAHFAVMPPALVEPCVLAGCPGQVCETCGAPWARVVERETNWQERRKAGAWAGNVGVSETYQNGVHGKGMSHDLGGGATRYLGYRPTCRCSANTGSGRGVALDPFMGAGTVGVVARRHSRHYLGIELNAEYIALAEARIAAETPAATLTPVPRRKKQQPAKKTTAPQPRTLWEATA